MQAGMAMAQQMMQENPEAVEQMRQMMRGMIFYIIFSFYS